VPLGLAIAWLEFGRFLALHNPSTASVAPPSAWLRRADRATDRSNPAAVLPG
jgi:hypothetical protein